MGKTKKCNEFFSVDIRKGGYILVGRNELKALYIKDAVNRQLAYVLLCVQTYAYFSPGQVNVDGKMYICRPGEWITTYSAVGSLTGMERRVVKRCLLQLEQYGQLHLENLAGCVRIVLQNYLHQKPAGSTGPAGQPADEGVGSAPGLIAGANAYYSNGIQEGGAN